MYTLYGWINQHYFPLYLPPSHPILFPPSSFRSSFKVLRIKPRALYLLGVWSLTYLQAYYKAGLEEQIYLKGQETKLCS